MSSLNKVLLLGRLGKDPDVRAMPDGTAVASFSIATSMITNKSGEKKEYTEWHRCVAFNKAAEIVRDYLKKGNQVFIEGSLRTRKWDDKGIERYTTEVVVGRLTMIGGKPTEPQSSPATAEEYAKASGGSYSEDGDYPF